MKNLIYTSLFFILFTGCVKEGLELEIPSTFWKAEYSVERVMSYHYTGSEWIMDTEEKDLPETFKYYLDFNEIRFISETEMEFVDSYDGMVYPTNYKKENDRFIYASPEHLTYEIEVTEDMDELHFTKVAGGHFDSLNPHPIVSASCYYEDCAADEVNGYIYADNKELPYYVIVVKETYTKR